MTESMDGAWVGGQVFTGDAFAEAFLVEGGRIVAAGSEDQIRRSKAPGTPTHALQGRTVVPGLIDAHLHLLEIARQRVGVDLRTTRSRDQILDQARNWATSHPNGPIVGRGWDQERWPDRQYPTQADLDRVSTDRPIILFRVCGHVAVVNQRVLDLIEVRRNTADPPGGRIGRAPNGEPNGLLFDAAMNPLFGPGPLNVTVRPDAVQRVLADAARGGLTTVASLNASAEEVTLLRLLVERESLPARVRLYLRGATWEETRPLRGGITPFDLRIAGGKMFADGSFGARTARLSEPYSDAPGERGVEVSSEERLAKLVRAVEAEGLTAAVHAIGDAALRNTLLAFEQQPRSVPRRIEHAALVFPEIFPRLDPLRPYLVVQPDFVVADWWLVDRIGPVRVRWAYPFKTLLDRGYVVAGSSDAPFGAFDPAAGIRAAMHRRDSEGRSANPAAVEALSIEEALQLYTHFGGITLGEPLLGHLKAGSPADFVILDSPTIASLGTAPTLPVLSTWKEGRPVFGSGLRSESGHHR
jgi:predicted amidohydrolase YtcJ